MDETLLFDLKNIFPLFKQNEDFMHYDRAESILHNRPFCCFQLKKKLFDRRKKSLINYSLFIIHHSSFIIKAERLHLSLKRCNRFGFNFCPACRIRRGSSRLRRGRRHNPRKRACCSQTSTELTSSSPCGIFPRIRL